MQLSKSFHIMTKPIGSVCNLDCKYCYYLEKENLYPSTKNFRMSENLLEIYIRDYIGAQQTEEVTFAWQGGEPTLLGIDFFKRAVQYQKKYAGERRIANSFQTNGLLINKEWAKFFADNNFLIGISIDGPAEYHDRYRVTKGQQPTHEKVMRALNLFKSYQVDFNTLSVVNRYNSYAPKDVYNFLKENGSQFMQFIPIVERKALGESEDGLKLVAPDYKGEAEVTEWSVEPLLYGKFLSGVFDEWVVSDVGSVFVQIFDIMLEAWYGLEPSLCVFRKTCGNALVLEHNGDLYSCDHYVYPKYKLGNILEKSMIDMVDSGKQIKFGRDKFNALPKYCLDCDYLFACHGECPKHRFLKTPDGEDGLNYLCAGYKYFYSHIDEYMKFMVNELKHERPPANVIEFAKRNLQN